jgi:multidrug resistance efflux pump
MAALLLLGYAAICVLIFKLLRVPVNKWTVTTAGLGGVTIVGGLLAMMNYNHPFTTDGRLYFYTTPIVPTVKGNVIEVAVRPNEQVKAGDLLFRIDPRPYQFVVEQKKALLADAEQGVKQLRASFEQASAGVEKARAQLQLAQQNYDRQEELVAKRVTAQATLDTATRNLEAATQTLAGAEAAAERARLAFSAQIDGVNTTVARLQADLGNAEFDLSQTSVTAPTNGYVTQLFLRPGMMASPSTSTMVFIHSDDNIFAASFPQNALQRVEDGNAVEIAFDGVPGRVFKGRVRVVVDAIAQGQLEASGNLLNPEDRSKTSGRAVTRIEITDDVSGYQLPAGSTAQVAVYTEHWPAVAIIRRVLLRMKAWMNYVV